MKYLLPLIMIFLATELTGCTTALPVQDVTNASDTPLRSPSPTSVKTEERKPWRSAVFKGIKIGQDSREVAKAKFGKPSWSGDPQGQDEEFPEIWDNFENIDELHKKITIMSSKKDGTILAIVSHQGDLPVEEALKIFGDDYVLTNYSPVPSSEDSESMDTVEDPKGSISQIEYRGKGIVLTFDYTKTRVQDIEFISETKTVKKNKR